MSRGRVLKIFCESFALDAKGNESRRGNDRWLTVPERKF